MAFMIPSYPSLMQPSQIKLGRCSLCGSHTTFISRKARTIRHPNFEHEDLYETKESRAVSMRSKREKWKHRKSKTSNSYSGSNASSTPSSRPIRVNTESSTLSLRQQLSLAKVHAMQGEQGAGREVVRTSFRRRKVSTHTVGNRIARRPSKASDEDDSMPKGKYVHSIPPILFVDGYNVIGFWPRLRRYRDRGDLNMARDLLLRDIEEYSHIRGWTCVLVYDAYRNDDPERIATTVRGVDIVYTGNETADSYIERSVYSTCEEGERQVWAASNDVAQMRFSGAKGAHIMSASLFVQEITRAKRESREYIEDNSGLSARGKMLMSNLDASTRDALYELRESLDAKD